MPTFSFICKHDGLIKQLVVSVRPENVTCDQCGNRMERLIANANSVVIKGGSAANDYYVAPTNAELGMGSSLDQEREVIKSSEEFLSEEDRDIKKDYDREKKQVQEELQARVKHINSKYGNYMNTFNKVLKDKIAKKKEQHRIK